MAYNLRTLGAGGQMLFVFLPASPRSTSDTTVSQVRGGFPAHWQLSISNPCISLLPCPLVSQHLVRSAWLHNWGGVNSPETVVNHGEWGQWSNTPSFQPVSWDSSEVHPTGFLEMSPVGLGPLVHWNNLSIMHILLTYFSSLPLLPYSLICASQVCAKS